MANMDESLLERGAQYLEDTYGGLRIRAYEPITEYIESSLITDDAAYLAHPDYVVTVVKSSHHDLGEFWPEMPWLYPAEVRVLAAVALAIPEGRGALGFAPHRSSRRLAIATTQKLTEEEVLQVVEAEARKLCEDVTSLWRPDILWGWGFESERNRRGARKHGVPYRLRTEQFVLAERLNILNEIDVDDSLLLRGL